MAPLRSSEKFLQEHLTASTRVFGELSDRDVFKSTMEIGCLEAVCRQRGFGAASRASLFLRRTDESSADSLATPAFVHPEQSHLADSFPGVLTEPRVDFAIGLAKQDREGAPILDSRGREVVVVDSVFQDLEIVAANTVRNQGARI